MHGVASIYGRSSRYAETGSRPPLGRLLGRDRVPAGPIWGCRVPYVVRRERQASLWRCAPNETNAIVP